MEFKIINKLNLTPDIKRLVITAPHIAQRAKPGQFLRVTPEEGDESIPLSIVETDPPKGTITLIVQETDQSSVGLGNIPINQPVFSILGPLGTPTTVEKKGTVVCIAHGTGIAQVLSMCRAFKKAGNKVIGIIGARNKKSIILEAQMRLACTKIFITTQDGSYERRGLVTDVLKTMIGKEEIDLVYVCAELDIMTSVCTMTKEKGIRTIVRVNPVMVDCMGMCGSCRIKVAGKIILACIEGLDFDGHEVDYDFLKIRLNAFKENEEWRNRQSQHNRRTKETKTFKRFLLGILKK